MKFRSWVGLLVLLSPLVLTSCSNNSSTSGSSSTGALYVTTQGDQMVSSFSANLGNGTLSAVGTSQGTGVMPAAMVLSPSGNALFVANSASGDISAFTVNSDGTLTAVSGSTLAGTSPVSMAFDPGGKLLFVADAGIPGSTTQVGSVLVYSVSGTTLTPVGSIVTTSSGAVNAMPVAVAVSVQASASFLYVANQNDGTVCAYQYDATGAATSLAPPYAVGTAPSALAVTPTATVIPNGTFLYVANSGSNNVSGFTIDPTLGTLTSVGTPFSAGLDPVSMAVSPKGKYLYVADKQSNQISSYVISPVSGVLTPAAPATTSTAINPVWVAVHPAGTWVYVANIGSASISILEIKSTGALGTPTGPLTTGGQPSAIALK
ncbi:MAG: beta-propeller fold lactonase family protein [Acidobacteriia bacterium]|nr:beta-propeller fold lactonase family protein [Terriglobia bacterium]